MSKERIICIDIGGTSTRVASATAKKQLLQNKKVFSTTSDFEKNFENITNSFSHETSPIKGIGIGIPGNLNPDKSMVIFANNLPGFVNQPFKEKLIQEYNCAVLLDSDAKVAALGEAQYGNPERTDFAYITWGTGIGGASVRYKNGRPQVEQLEWKKYFEQWETDCGGKNIEKKRKKKAENLNDNEWKEIVEAFTHQLAAFIDKVKPPKIIFGGGISIKQSDRLIEIFPLVKDAQIQTSILKEDAGLYGALSLITQSPK